MVAGTFRQRDSDLDGLGDACDPVGTWDDDNNGIPDDILTYNLAISCRALPLARLVVAGGAERMDERGNVHDLIVGQRELRHAAIETTVPHDRRDQLAAMIEKEEGIAPCEGETNQRPSWLASRSNARA